MYVQSQQHSDIYVNIDEFEHSLFVADKVPDPDLFGPLFGTNHC